MCADTFFTIEDNLLTYGRVFLDKYYIFFLFK